MLYNLHPYTQTETKGKSCEVERCVFSRSCAAGILGGVRAALTLRNRLLPQSQIPNLSLSQAAEASRIQISHVSNVNKVAFEVAYVHPGHLEARWASTTLKS